MNLLEGRYYLVKVVKLINAGAVVELEDGSTELVHISQISERFVDDPSNFLELGRCYSAQAVLGTGSCLDKLTLSFKYLNIAPKRPKEYTHTATDSGRNNPKSDYRKSSSASLCDTSKHSRNVLKSTGEANTEAGSLDAMIEKANRDYIDKTSRKGSGGNYPRRRSSSKRRFNY